MDEKKLEKLHTDLKRSAEVRGGRGGLGKAGSKNAKRIQIDYVEKGTKTEDTTKTDPKHIFIKFIRSSEEKKDNEKSKIANDAMPTSNNLTIASSDESENDKKARSAKSKAKSEKIGSLDEPKLMNLAEGESFTALFDGEASMVILGGVGYLVKATLSINDGATLKFRNCFLQEIRGDSTALFATIWGKPKSADSSNQIWQGQLLRSKIGLQGAFILAKQS